jgi:hypothetical protein
MISLDVKPPKGMAQIARALHNASDDINRELKHDLYRVAAQYGKVVPKEVHLFVPSGFVEVFRAGLVVNGDVHLSSSGPTIRMKARASTAGGKKSEIAKIERGILRHPVFGNRERWVNQRIKPGFFSKTILKHQDILSTAVVEVMQRVAAKIGAI